MPASIRLIMTKRMTYNIKHSMEIKNSSRSNKNDFWQALFDANSIAVIGANATVGTWGFNIFSQLLDSTKTELNRQVYAINSRNPEILGVTSYSSILNVPGKVELAIIVVPSHVVSEVLSECVLKEVKAAVIISAGFAEVDEDGAKLEAELVETARRGGIHFVGPNSVGHANVYSRLGSAGMARRMDPGPMGVISQSGTMGARITATAANNGIGISKFVSAGNEADQHLEDYLEYLAQDKDTEIIAAYIEGLREGRRFFQLARETTIKKPIVVIKAGGTDGSARAARSHTAALTGSDEIYTAAFRQTGVIRVDDDEELCDMVIALLHQPLPRGNKVGILTLGGGIGVVTTEACEKEGLAIASLEPVTMKKLDAILPPRWSHGNPVDTAGVFGRPADNYEIVLSCLGILMEDNNIDGVISLASPIRSTFDPRTSLNSEQIETIRIENEKNLGVLSQYVKNFNKPLVICERSMFLSPNETDPLSLFLKEGIPVYPHPRRAAKVMRRLAWYQKYLEYRKQPKQHS